ncbi:hypothetical protein M378DRAFT_90201 [Amanita muscaria Koide BX008]|uniref:Uncharacterized protein n=1 Tax=Amanita muscaria (strain Koide BX008) TaxID=946122 RepID=A0A0C2WGT5_AMAMK|nr:hypothetical protein M378DRAFT_90201 [Amanita muscaria Koide BX008]
MGRRRVYSTHEEQKAANRAKSKRHYERNKVAIRERRRERYREAPRPEVCLRRFKSMSPPHTCGTRDLDYWCSSAAQVKRKFEKLTSGSPPKDYVNSIVQNIILNQKEGPLKHAIKIISGLLQRIQRAESKVLAQHGLCDSYQQVVAIGRQVRELNVWLEEILCCLMLSISELHTAFLKSQLMYQTI